MSLVSKVGQKSIKTRAFFLGVYLLLSIGAVTMVYPFLLMLSMGTTSIADFGDFELLPRYWMNDKAMFRKYLMDAATIEELAVWFGKDGWFSPLDVKEDDFSALEKMPAQNRKAIASDMREFVSTSCPGEFKMPLFLVQVWGKPLAYEDMPLALQSEYFSWLKQRYGSVGRVNKIYRDNAATWQELGVPVEQPHRVPDLTARMKDWREFIESRTPDRTGLFHVDMYVYMFLRTVGVPESYKSVSCENSISSITFDELAAGKLGPDLQRQFMTANAWARFLKIDTRRASGAWQAYLEERGLSTDVTLMERMPAEERYAGLWGQFVQSRCPLDTMTLLRPETYWRSFLKGRYHNIEKLNSIYGTDYSGFEQVRIPYAVFHYDNFLAQKDALRIKYLTHNFKVVFSYIAVHGQALMVTIVYIVLAIATALTVNPLAAYAMSRFRLKESYHVLIFLLATMAFPGEVLMIPNFLMIKSFPILQLVIVGVCLLGFALLRSRLSKRIPDVLSATLALAVTVILVGWVAPKVASMLNIKTSVTLMNTYWALVLPGLANGYGIFLLKGFFDSLPPELYEAGLIDGAGETTMFWKITLPLCKPVLAVLALGSFTAAYGAFMHAFLVCQDPKMWTLMVFLYEFQQTHTMPLAMASLVIAAIPTLLVFVFCQNIILRGIVIPTYK